MWSKQLSYRMIEYFETSVRRAGSVWTLQEIACRETMTKDYCKHNFLDHKDEDARVHFWGLFFENLLNFKDRYSGATLEAAAWISSANRKIGFWPADMYAKTHEEVKGRLPALKLVSWKK